METIFQNFYIFGICAFATANYLEDNVSETVNESKFERLIFELFDNVY